MNQLAGRLARVSVVVLLGSLSVLLTVRPELGDQDTFEKQIPITRVVEQGPTVVDDVEWTLKSLKAYTMLADEEHQQIDLKVPDNAVVVVATLTLRSTDRTKLNDGFHCDADLNDDRGNRWEDEEVVSGYPLPTFCGDDKVKKLERGTPFTAAKVFIVPKDAVPHLTGLTVPGADASSAEERVLLTP
ncbi:MAG TPA: hypothetical protein VGJ44_27290 [Kribbellaceae bacterium]